MFYYTVLVCGGRRWGYIHHDISSQLLEDHLQTERLYRTLDEIFAKLTLPQMRIIAGEASGADYFGKMWAIKNLGKENYQGYSADWEKYGKSAGPVRNVQMLNEGKPDLVVACSGGIGTNHMKTIAIAQNIQIVEISYAN